MSVPGEFVWKILSAVSGDMERGREERKVNSRVKMLVWVADKRRAFEEWPQRRDGLHMTGTGHKDLW